MPTDYTNDAGRGANAGAYDSSVDPTLAWHKNAVRELAERPDRPDRAGS